MDIDPTTLITFSPTGTTRRVLEAIARGLGTEAIERLDLTPPEAAIVPLQPVDDGLALIGAPVYGGRIPAEAARRLRRLQAHGVPAVVVAVYGNRAYEDALLELRDLAVGAGFTPVAGAAFIGEHSFDTEATPIATGRPDDQDLRAAAAFGERVRDKMAAMVSLAEMGQLSVPGDFPYKQGGEGRGISPVTGTELCTRCGTCVAVCPTGAVSLNGSVETDAAACIMCSACVKACATGARVWQADWVLRVADWLTTSHGDRKEPEVFL